MMLSLCWYQRPISPFQASHSSSDRMMQRFNTSLRRTSCQPRCRLASPHTDPRGSECCWRNAHDRALWASGLSRRVCYLCDKADSVFCECPPAMPSPLT